MNATHLVALTNENIATTQCTEFTSLKAAQEYCAVLYRIGWDKSAVQIIPLAVQIISR